MAWSDTQEGRQGKTSRQLKAPSWGAWSTPALSWSSAPPLEAASRNMGGSDTKPAATTLTCPDLSKPDPKLRWIELPDGVEQPPWLSWASHVQQMFGSSGQENLPGVEMLPEGTGRNLRGSFESPRREKQGLKANILVNLSFYTCKTEQGKESPRWILHF